MTNLVSPSLRVALALLLLAGLAGGQDDPPADPPQDPKAAKREEREKKAETLWTNAKASYDAQKWADAQAGFRELRERFMDTKAYSDNRKDIADLDLKCGYKIAAVALTKVSLSKKPHIDTILGLRFFPPDGWRGIPNWQDIYGQRDTSEQDYRDRSFRCARYTSRFLDNVYLNAYKTYAPSEGAKTVAEGAFKIYTRDPKGMKMISETVFKHRHQALKQIHEDEEGNRYAVYAFFDPASKKGFGLVGYWKLRDDSLFFFTSDTKAEPPEQKDWDAAVKAFDQVAGTMEIMEQSVLAKTRVDAKGWGIASDGWCVKCADWNVLNTRNYTIEYACRKDFADRVGKELEQILTLYQRVIPSSKGVERGRVKIFDCEADFQYYGQAPGAAAYWSPMQREIVAYRFEGRKVKAFEGNEEMTVAEEKNPEEVTFNILYHEAFHQYMENYMGISRDVYVPSWINEGMGDYFFGGRWLKNGKFEIGLNDWRLETIHAAVKANKHVPLKKIVYYKQSDYYSDAGLCYAEGWAICYFFMSDEGKKKGYDRYITAMYNECKKSGERGEAKKATDKVFAGCDFEKLEAEWKAFVLGLEKFLPKDGKKPEENRR